MDNNIVIYSKLKEILQELWNRVKEKFNTSLVGVVFNEDTNTLTFTKGDSTQEDVALKNFVEDWGDLEHTKYAKIQNIFDKNTQVVNDKKYTFVSNGGGELHTDNTCKIARIPCKAGDMFTVVKGATHDSQQMGVFNSSNGHLQAMTVGAKKVNGKQVYKVTIPSALTNAHYFVFNMYNQHVSPDEVMVFEGHLTDDQIPSKYYPNLGNYTAVIDGDKVAIEFNKDSTSLQSNTVVEAIKELDGKIVNAGGGTVKSVNGEQPDHNGNVAIGINNIPQLQNSLDNKVNTSLVGNDANKIPRLNNQGKLVDDIIPELAITRIVDVVDKADALNKASSADIQEGDFVRLTNEQNKIYIHNGVVAGDFNARFVEISLGEATVRTVNGETPRPNGEVTVHGNQISAYDGVSAKSVQGHLTDLRTTVNNHSTRISALESKKPTVHVGEIITTFKDNGDSYNLNGVTYLYCGKAQVITRANYAQLMDALGLAGVQRSELPVISDQTIQYDLGQRRAVRKHYIVAKM